MKTPQQIEQKLNEKLDELFLLEVQTNDDLASKMVNIGDQRARIGYMQGLMWVLDSKEVDTFSKDTLKRIYALAERE